MFSKTNFCKFSVKFHFYVSIHNYRWNFTFLEALAVSSLYFPRCGHIIHIKQASKKLITKVSLYSSLLSFAFQFNNISCTFSFSHEYYWTFFHCLIFKSYPQLNVIEMKFALKALLHPFIIGNNFYFSYRIISMAFHCSNIFHFHF